MTDALGPAACTAAIWRREQSGGSLFMITVIDDNVLVGVLLVGGSAVLVFITTTWCCCCDDWIWLAPELGHGEPTTGFVWVEGSAATVDDYLVGVVLGKVMLLSQYLRALLLLQHSRAIQPQLLLMITATTNSLTPSSTSYLDHSIDSCITPATNLPLITTIAVLTTFVILIGHIITLVFLSSIIVIFAGGSDTDFCHFFRSGILLGKRGRVVAGRCKSITRCFFTSIQCFFKVATAAGCKCCVTNIYIMAQLLGCLSMARL